MISPPLAAPQTLAEFESLADAEWLRPLWLGGPPRKTAAKPYLWKWAHLRQRMLEAVRLIPLGTEGAERRVLALRNPGLGAMGAGTTATLIASVQVVGSGETAPAHRHTPAALRFMKEGDGAYTIVNGQQVPMEAGDLILTPALSWHSHINQGSAPIMWMDGLDAPMVNALDMFLQEEFPSADRRQPVTVRIDESRFAYGGAGLLPAGDVRVDPNSPLLRYTWRDAEERLMGMSDQPGSPFDGSVVRYTNPVTGGPVMPMIDCRIQRLRPGEHTRAHRHTGSSIYNVQRGSGTSIVDGERLDWSDGDIFCIPSWAWHEHINGSAGTDAVLFSMHDSPIVQAAGLYREEAMGEGA